VPFRTQIAANPSLTASGIQKGFSVKNSLCIFVYMLVTNIRPICFMFSCRFQDFSLATAILSYMFFFPVGPFFLQSSVFTCLFPSLNFVPSDWEYQFSFVFRLFTKYFCEVCLLAQQLFLFSAFLSWGGGGVSRAEFLKD
jgi:hypothetical protein